MPHKLFGRSKLEVKYRIFIGLPLVVLSIVSWWWIVQKEINQIKNYAQFRSSVYVDKILAERFASNESRNEEMLRTIKEKLRQYAAFFGPHQRVKSSDGTVDWRLILISGKNIPIRDYFRPRNDAFEKNAVGFIETLNTEDYNRFERHRVVQSDGQSYKMQYIMPLAIKKENCLACHGGTNWDFASIKAAVSFTFNPEDLVEGEFGHLLASENWSTISQRDGDEDAQSPPQQEYAWKQVSLYGNFDEFKSNTIIYSALKELPQKAMRIEEEPYEDTADYAEGAFFGTDYVYNWPLRVTSQCVQCHNDYTAGAVAGSLIVKVPSASLINYVRAYKVLVFTLLVSTILIVLFVLYLLVRYVSIQPLSDVMKTVSKVSAGDYNAAVTVKTGDELETLADAFNAMVAKIKDTHEGLQKLNVDLDNKVNELGAANLKLFEMNRLKSEFLANMSHELKTPLNSIIGFSDVLREGLAGDLNEKQKRYVRNIGLSGNQLLRLIGEVLDMAKIEAGKVEMKRDYVAPASIVDNVVAQLQPTLKPHQTLLSHIDKDIPVILIDEDKITRILYNLVTNALKFTPNQGVVTVSVGFRNGTLFITVSDTGIGINPADREVIFDKFRQVDGSTTRKFGGAGLGLSIVKELVNLFEGDIKLDSDLGKGSLFFVKIPVSTGNGTTVESNT